MKIPFNFLRRNNGAPGRGPASRRPRDIALFILALAVLLFAVLRPVGKKVIPEIIAPTITFIHHWEGREEFVAGLIAEYEALHGGITVIGQYLPRETLNAKLAAIGSGGTDAVVNDGDVQSSGETPDAGEGEVFNPDVVAVPAAWIPGLLADETIESETFALLTFFNPLFYNIEILEKAGQTRPPKTRGEFLAQARAVTGNGTFAIAEPSGGDGSHDARHGILPWIVAAGITAGNADKGAAKTKEALAFLSTLINEKLVLPGSASFGEDEKRAAFLAGKTAFFLGSAEDMEILKAGLGGALGYTAIPAPDSYLGKPVFTGGGWSAAVLDAGRHREEARSFAAYLYEQRNALSGFWAVPDNGSFNTVSDAFYAKARELYVSGELVFASLENVLTDEGSAAIEVFLRETQEGN